MKKLIFAIVLICFILAQSYVQAESVILWQWADGAGKVHFTSNFNSIPEAYRSKAVQGKFVPDKPLKPTNSGKNNTANAKNSKVTNKLEVYEEKYYEKEDMLVVEGKVRNGFSQPMSNIKIKVTFYDKDDNFMKSETTFVDPLLLQPGDEGHFKIQTPITPDIASYEREIKLE